MDAEHGGFWSHPARAALEAAQHLDLLAKTTLLLLESSDEHNWVEVLKLVVEHTGATHACVFLDAVAPDGAPSARLSATWSAHGASWLADFGGLRTLFYARCPNLADRLRVGMVFAATHRNMPMEEATLFGAAGITSVLAIPLLVRGEAVGFLALFSVAPEKDWSAAEIEVLCTVANELSLAWVRRRMQDALRSSEARLKALVGVTEDVVLEYDGAQTIHALWTENAHFRALLRGEAVGALLADALPEPVASRLVAATREALREKGGVHVEFTLASSDGPRFWLGRVSRLPGDADPPHLVAALRDVTPLKAEEARQRVMVDTLNLLDEHIEADDHGALLSAMEVLRRGEKGLATLRLRLARPGEEVMWVECRLLGIRDPDGGVLSVRAVVRDITAAYLQERRIRELALHDALTGLPNRVLFEELLQQAMARASRNGTKIALGFIDLDYFKHINDTLGHKAGDRVLLTLSQRLSQALRDSDVLSRWGGDEFVVLLGDATDENDFRCVAERLREAAREPMDLDGIETRLTLSIGLALYPDDAEDPETLMSLADHTMFHAKSMGRNNVQFFREIEGTVLDKENVRLQTRLAQAIQEDLIQVFYQPVIETKSGRIVCVEALARWHDEQHGWVPPEIFIPMAEHLGLIHDLGHRVLAHTLKRLATWHAAGHDLKAAVNVSRAQLFAPGFVEGMTDAVTAHGLKPADLVLEITESVALLDLSYEARRLSQLAEAGFELAIDDFGTGYSGLAQLHDMPVRALKVDASFTRRLASENGRRIVQAIAQMAEALGLATVVEGVETAEQVAFLEGLGIPYLQGDHFGEAAPAGVIDMLLAR